MGYFQINAGGKVEAFGHSIKGADGKWRPATKDDYRNDPGKTTLLVDDDGKEVNPTHCYQEAAWKRADRERTERGRNYFPGRQGADIERQLWAQIGGKPSQGEFNATVERGLWQMNLHNDRVKDLSVELFNQIANAPR